MGVFLIVWNLEAKPCESTGQTNGLPFLQLEKVGQSIDTYWRPPSGDMLTSYIDGFSLNAKFRINASNRSGLEHLCRYINRPPISID